MDYGFIAYIFVAIAIILGVFSQLNNSGRTWSAIVSLVLLILIFVFYGQRWFEGTSGKFSSPRGAWPPIINMCPDYLVYFKHSSGVDTCVDMLGVSSNSSLSQWNDTDTSTPPDLQSSNSYISGSNAKYFKHIYKPGLNAAELKVLCDKAMEAGLKWEGITNGDACTYST